MQQRRAYPELFFILDKATLKFFSAVVNDIFAFLSFSVALCETWQDRASSSLPGSFPGVGGAIPPPATKI